MENTFEPRKSISERYSLENMAKQRGMSIDDYKLEIDKQLKMKQDIIDKQLSKGWTQEQAETHAMRCLYIDGFSGPTFEPRKSISERYSLENMAKQRGMSIDDYKLEIDKQLKMKQDIIDKQLSKGWTQEQAETHAMRCLYIDGFSGPTFKD